jgi:hypothetical protein
MPYSRNEPIRLVTINTIIPGQLAALLEKPIKNQPVNVPSNNPAILSTRTSVIIKQSVNILLSFFFATSSRLFPFRYDRPGVLSLFAVRYEEIGMTTINCNTHKISVPIITPLNILVTKFYLQTAYILNHYIISKYISVYKVNFL